MKTEEMEPDTEYPSDWDNIEKNKNEKGPSEFLKFKSGEDQRLRILQGPRAFCSLYLDAYENGVPKKGKDGKPYKKTYNFPQGTVIPGQKKPRAQYAFEVLVLEGPQAGAHMMLIVGQQAAEDLRTARGDYGDITKCDIKIGKTGEGLETKWSARGLPPTKVEAEHLKPVFNMREKIKFATKEEIEAFPKAEQMKDSMDTKLSSEQAKLIVDLIGVKELSATEVEKLLLRKTKKKDVDDLTVAEASAVIESLKAY